MSGTIRTAIADADSDGGGEVVLDRGVNLIATTEDDANGVPCGLLIPDRVWLRGQGSGNTRGGGAEGRSAATELWNTANPSLSGSERYSLIKIEGANDWRKAGVSHMNLEDHYSTTDDVVDNLLLLSGVNGCVIENVGFGNAFKAGARDLSIERSTAPPAGSPDATQYNRILWCTFWSENHGIYIEGNNPDTEIWGTQIQHAGGASPVSGATGLYVGSSAVRMFGGEIQMFDIGLHLDGSSSRGRHFLQMGTHYEGHQGASSGAYEAAIKITGAGSLQKMLAKFQDCEIGNRGKFTDIFNIGTNVYGTRVRAFRIRDEDWLTDAHSQFTDSGTNTTVA